MIEDVGFRAPDRVEEARVLATPLPETRPLLRGAKLPAAVIARDPLISYSGLSRHAPLGLAGLVGDRLASRDAWFLLSPTWSIESREVAEELRARAVRHRRLQPRHRLVFVCNTSEEETEMRAVGEAAVFYNKTANVSEAVFRPLPGEPRIFDAVYNAQLSAWKRHELALAVPSCAFIFYRDSSGAGGPAVEAAIIARHRAVPGHVFLNPFREDGVPLRFPAREVNRQLNRAHVGLCLSEKEGAMFASVEYLLAGLPIVTTPSSGGRHVYHDPEFSLTVPADPRAVAEAVAVLKARAIPRERVRTKTLARIERDRARFVALLNSILADAQRLTDDWPFRKGVTMEWLLVEDAVDRAAYGVVDAFARKSRHLIRWRRRIAALLPART